MGETGGRTYQRRTDLSRETVMAIQAAAEVQGLMALAVRGVADGTVNLRETREERTVTPSISTQRTDRCTAPVLEVKMTWLQRSWRSLGADRREWS